MTRLQFYDHSSTRDRQVLRASTVIAGKKLEPLRDAVVVIEDGQIAWVGPAANGPSVDVELDGVTLIPGLIDTHVHLWSDSGPRLDSSQSTESELTLRIANNLRRFLATGVTTVRDLGSPGVVATTVRDAVADGKLVGPRMLVANRVITVTGGHGHQMGIECDSEESLRRSVRQLVKDGSDWIKVMASGGFVHFRRPEGPAPFLALFSEHELRIIVEESHRYGLRVAAHCQNRESIKNAFQAGVDTIEHCTFASIPHALLDEKLAIEIAARGTYVVPTVNNYWLSVGVPWAPRDIALANLRRLRELGVRLVAGSDMGIPTTEPEHYAQGLRVLHEIGMDAFEVLQAATVSAADAIGLSSVTGALEVGLSADIVGLAGDPLTNIDAYLQPRIVISRGELYLVPSIPPRYAHESSESHDDL